MPAESPPAPIATMMPQNWPLSAADRADMTHDSQTAAPTVSSSSRTGFNGSAALSPDGVSTGRSVISARYARRARSVVDIAEDDLDPRAAEPSGFERIGAIDLVMNPAVPARFEPPEAVPRGRRPRVA